MIVAVDFDGTCVTHEFPRVGEEIGAAEVLKELTDKGHKIILFTMRSHPNEINQMRILLIMMFYKMQ
jgi:hydroxymethylpyrimidine pyrophosphatase-like HAD family hydrolase